MEKLELSQELIDSGTKLYIYLDGEYRAITNVRWKSYNERFLAQTSEAPLRIIELRRKEPVYAERRFGSPVLAVERHPRAIPAGWGVVKE